jgi:aldehyde dehydrogenase (NAD+)
MSVSLSSDYFYIDGVFCDAASGAAAPKHSVVNPSTEETLFQLLLGSARDVDLAVEAASVAFV